MDERTEPEPLPSDAARPGGRPGGAELASPELAALYIQQGEYERGIAMYKTLLERAPTNRDLRERLDDAEALADLLILREGAGSYRSGFKEGYRRAAAEHGGQNRDDRITRLSAWLERVKGQA